CRRRHAAVQAVKSMRLLDEIGRRFRRAADAAHLGKLVRLDAIVVQRLDNVIGNRVVAAAGAQRRRKSFINFASQSDDVEISCHVLGYSATTAGWRSASKMGSATACASIGTPL